MGRKRKYESEDPAERARLRQAAYYARNREKVLARQRLYRQRPEVAERRSANARAAYPVQQRRLKMNPARYAAKLASHRASDTKWRASKREGKTR